MQLHELVAVSAQVAATRSRSKKIELVASTLARLDEHERSAGLAYLAGEPRQPRLELGPAAVYGIEVPPAAAAQLTLRDVDSTLQAIADVAAGPGSRTRRLELLTSLLQRATAEEQPWLRALVLRELRQGSLEGLLVSAVASAADVPEATVRRAAMLLGDVRQTAMMALEGGIDALEAVRLQVGVPLQPMLASTATDVASAVESLGEVLVDAKLDGARVQVHRAENRVWVFSRSLADITSRVPEVVAATLGLPVQQVVLDGEAIALDEAGRPRRFQETMQRFGRDRTGAAVPADPRPGGPLALTVRFFDVLHADGVDVMDLPLRQRVAVLERVVPAGLRVEGVVTADAEVAQTFAARTLAAGHEGVMVKDLDTTYEAGRRGAGWRKVKPVHTLDLVVLAAEWGSGRRRGWLSNLHLGARADDGAGFVMLGKTFKGLTDEVLAWQTTELLARETHRTGHVVHVRPELVVEIALDGFLKSTRYPGGIALRFARVRGYRPDKLPAEADTLATARAIFTGDRPPS